MFASLCAAGQEPAGVYRQIIAAARAYELLDDPFVLVASQWQDFQHPRGKDGTFIQTDSAVNVYASETDSITDRTAPVRRAKIEKLTPQGAVVSYSSPDGADLEPDPAAGFPDVIPVNQLAGKVAAAPVPIARLPLADGSVPKTADVTDTLSADKTPESAGHPRK